MGKVIFDISMSLGGFMTATNPSPRGADEPIDVIDTPAATHLRFRVVK